MVPVVPAQSASGTAAGLDVSAIAACVLEGVRHRSDVSRRNFCKTLGRAHAAEGGLDQPCRRMVWEGRGLSQASLSEGALVT